MKKGCFPEVGLRIVQQRAGTVCLCTEAERYAGITSHLTSPYHHLLPSCKSITQPACTSFFQLQDRELIYSSLFIKGSVICVSQLPEQLPATFIKYDLSERKWHTSFHLALLFEYFSMALNSGLYFPFPFSYFGFEPIRRAVNLQLKYWTVGLKSRHLFSLAILRNISLFDETFDRSVVTAYTV